MQTVKKIFKQVQKTFCEKMGNSRVSKTRLWVNWYSLCMLQLVGGEAQSLRSLTVGSSTTSSFNWTQTVKDRKDRAPPPTS